VPPRWYPAAVTSDDPELTEWLASYRELLDAMRRLTALTERLLQRGAHGPLLSAEEAQDAHRDLEATRTAVEQLDAMLTLRRQQLRPM
jgi:hypothetical protein